MAKHKNPNPHTSPTFRQNVTQNGQEVIFRGIDFEEKQESSVEVEDGVESLAIGGDVGVEAGKFDDLLQQLPLHARALDTQTTTFAEGKGKGRKRKMSGNWWKKRRVEKKER